MGGPGTVSAGKVQESVQTLEPGSYLMFCLVRARSGEAHAADGMVDQFKVVANAARHPAPRPSAELRLPGGKGAAAAEPYLRQLRSPELLRQPSPFPAAGGVSALSPGRSADLHLALTPGDYLAIWLVPGQDGTPHAMAVVFHVR